MWRQNHSNVIFQLSNNNNQWDRNLLVRKYSFHLKFSTWLFYTMESLQLLIVVICLWQSYPMAGKGLMILNTEPTTLSKYKNNIGKTVHFDRLFLFSAVHVLLKVYHYKFSRLFQSVDNYLYFSMFSNFFHSLMC